MNDHTERGAGGRQYGTSEKDKQRSRAKTILRLPDLEQSPSSISSDATTVDFRELRPRLEERDREHHSVTICRACISVGRHQSAVLQEAHPHCFRVRYEGARQGRWSFPHDLGKVDEH